MTEENFHTLPMLRKEGQEQTEENRAKKNLA